MRKALILILGIGTLLIFSATTAQAQKGYVEICIPEPKLLRIKGRGVGIRLTNITGVFGTAIPAGDGRWEINSFSNQIKYMLTPIKGSLFMDAPWKETKCDYIVANLFPNPDSGVLECAAEEFHSIWHKRNYTYIYWSTSLWYK